MNNRGIRPDDTGMTPRPGQPGGNGGGQNKPMMEFGFMPGQIRNLAGDMASAQGGSLDKWKEYLRGVYSPVVVDKFSYGGGGGGNGGGNGGKGGGKPPVDDRQSDDNSGFNPAHRDKRQLVGHPQQGLLNAPGMQMQQAPATLGFLGQPPQMGGQSQLPPEIMALLAQRR